MKARDARLGDLGKSTSHDASIPTERRYAKPVPTPSQSSRCAHEDTHAHRERVNLAHEAGPAREAKPARKIMKPFETGPARKARPMCEAMHGHKLVIRMKGGQEVEPHARARLVLCAQVDERVRVMQSSNG